MEPKSLDRENIRRVRAMIRALLHNLDHCGISDREQSIALRELSDELNDTRSPLNPQRDFLLVVGSAIAFSLAIVFILMLVALVPLLI